MNAPETFWFEGAEGTRVQAMLIRPPHFGRGEEISAARTAARRAADDVGECVGLSMERRDIFRSWIRNLDD